MVKNRNGNNRDGLGILDLMYLARYCPGRYWITIMAIQLGYRRLAKRMLDIK